MKALRVHGFEGIHQWALEEVPDPSPQAGEVQVRILANPISYVDLLFATGGYQVKPPLPLVPGTEFAGVVTALGTGVDGSLQVGQRITGMTVGGAWAELACVAAAGVTPLPDGADAQGASVLPVTYATALYALKQRGAVRAGETVLVLGAAGGVGLASVQVAKALGAKVVAATTGAQRILVAKDQGADHTVELEQADWRAAVRAVAPDGIDVVVDTLGDKYTETAFRTLRWGGRHLVIGFAAGDIPSLKCNLAIMKGSSLVGVDIRQFRELEPERARSNLAETVAMFASGGLRPHIAQVYRSADWAAAVRQAQDVSTVGRVVLTWN